jgi:hypothetical protein
LILLTSIQSIRLPTMRYFREPDLLRGGGQASQQLLEKLA